MVSCGPKKQTWEYKVVKVAGQDAEILADYGSLVYGDQTTMLNKMGKDGWELVSTYTEIATAFPNFGNSEYVTGIMPAKVDIKPEIDAPIKQGPNTESNKD